MLLIDMIKLNNNYILNHELQTKYRIFTEKFNNYQKNNNYYYNNDFQIHQFQLKFLSLNHHNCNYKKKKKITKFVINLKLKHDNN